jgi:hypothetical protein
LHLFCPSSSAWQSEGFVNLAGWLASQGKTPNTVREIIIFAKRFGFILNTGDASPLLTLSPRNRHHVMSSLASWSKYNGKYQLWREICSRYSLKWSSGNESLQALQRFFNPDTSTSLDGMLQQIRLMIKKTPSLMGKIIKFGVLVGLRSAEIVESVRLINSGVYILQYYNPKQQVLQHYKFPQFLRTTKKAYLSFVTPEMLQGVRTHEQVPSYNAIRLTCQRRGIMCDMRYCRKIYATYLHQEGIPVEIIDALQGRTPANIFAKWYYRPSLDYKVQVLRALEKLKNQL